ncbi:putative bifunctional diguanylate cyclase/phosphodiesterase [Nakamurella alba]|nr:EAL domain-containing protein [Nakamurella alba]
MSGWELTAAFNIITALAYLGICLTILRGLVHTGQIRTNLLALATAGIFLTCAAHHSHHALHLLVDDDPVRLAAVRSSFDGWSSVLIDVIAAAVGITYLSMRSRYSVLLRSPSMFDVVGEARYRQLASTLPQTTVVLYDRDMRVLLAEGVLEDLPVEGSLEGRLLSDILQDEVFAMVEPMFARVLAGDSVDTDFFHPVDRKTYRLRIQPIFGEKREISGGVVFAENVTEDRARRAQLAEAIAFNQAVLAASPDITMITDLRTGEITWSSRSVLDMLDWPADGDTGIVTTGRSGSWSTEGPADTQDRLDDLVALEDVGRLRAAERAVLELPDGESVTVRYRMRGGDGGERWLSRRSTPFSRDVHGAVVSSLSIVREITDAMNAEQQLQHAALHDPLTGLPNRSLLVDRIASAIARVDRDDGEVAVLFCDLDNFKRINDSAGHAAGDAVLREVAERLVRSLRKGDSVARVGGDEFVIVLEAAAREEDPDDAEDTVSVGGESFAVNVARRVIAAVGLPIRYEGHDLTVSISVGLTFARRDSIADDVLRDADAAMYLAKQHGRDRFEIFDDSLRAEVAGRDRVEHALREALGLEPATGARLSVAYQPQYDLTDGRLVGFEALARLIDSSGANIPPDQFVPVAEARGLIAPLGATVLEVSLGDLAVWHRTHPDGPAPKLAVNFSARQAQQADLSELVLSSLRRHDLSPSDLTLELTESILLETGSSGMRQLGTLHEAGVGIAIDDFGTGYASLSYLATLPISSLKVDRSFTAGMPHEKASATIVRSIAALAAELGLSCVVEGIETERQLAALPAGVLGQGYLLGRPSPGLDTNWAGVPLPRTEASAGQPVAG